MTSFSKPNPYGHIKVLINIKVLLILSVNTLLVDLSHASIARIVPVTTEENTSISSHAPEFEVYRSLVDNPPAFLGKVNLQSSMMRVYDNDEKHLNSVRLVYEVDMNGVVILDQTEKCIKVEDMVLDNKDCDQVNVASDGTLTTGVGCQIVSHLQPSHPLVNVVKYDTATSILGGKNDTTSTSGVEKNDNINGEKEDNINGEKEDTTTSAEKNDVAEKDDTNAEKVVAEKNESTNTDVVAEKNDSAADEVVEPKEN